MKTHCIHSRYDPYGKNFTQEYYDTQLMHKNRQAAIQSASTAQTFGLILGTLGRQGSTAVYNNLRQKLDSSGKKYILVLLSEIFPGKLDLFKEVDAWIQVACPRLSIDWGLAFTKPLLTPYEASVALEGAQWRARYPMDYYANNSAGNWTVNSEANRPTRSKPRRNHVKISLDPKLQ